MRVGLPLLEVDVGLLADDVCVSSSDSLDLGQGVHDLPSSINVGVEESENVLELHVGLGNDERPTEAQSKQVIGVSSSSEGKGGLRCA